MVQTQALPRAPVPIKPSALVAFAAVAPAAPEAGASAVAFAAAAPAAPEAAAPAVAFAAAVPVAPANVALNPPAGAFVATGGAVAPYAGAGGGGVAGQASCGDAAILALARKTAERLWGCGGGELPPGWDYEVTDDGDCYFVMPDMLNPDGSVAVEGATSWEDPRENFETYVEHFVAAASRGVDLAKL
jgi:hypothetical protein